ncbi:MAG TPA: hypothetical protein VK619_06905 [Pyrinomonadaceae bacterium]|nr:hypothetical protein [Pyrinomonadaceae bacterium]
MAEERTVGLARAPETDDDDDSTKAELQRRMEEARESITQTVSEIRDTVVNKYESVKETVSETLDWREQYRRRPIAWSVGAGAVGLLVGYSLASAFKGDGEDYSEVWNEDDSPQPKAYAAQAITGGHYGSSTLAQPAARAASSERDFGSQPAPDASPASVASLDAPDAENEEEKDSGPGLIERFKGTKAYDRLEEEVSHLGERFVDELSRTAQSVVLPLIFNKIKNYFGLDLSSNKQRGQSQTGGASQATSAPRASTSQEDQGQNSTSYGKSPNLPYGAQSP